MKAKEVRERPTRGVPGLGLDKSYTFISLPDADDSLVAKSALIVFKLSLPEVEGSLLFLIDWANSNNTP
jgi:hypothetical protein